MQGMNFNAAVERARARLDIEHPRVEPTRRSRLYRFIFGVWPAGVVIENLNRAECFRTLVEEEVEAEVARWRSSRG